MADIQSWMPHLLSDVSRIMPYAIADISKVMPHDVSAALYTISGNIVDNGSPPLPLENVEVSDGTRDDLTDASGDYTITGVPNGSYTLTPTLADYTFAPVTLAALVAGANLTGKDFVGTSTGPAYTETFESATWQADSSWTAFQTFNTSLDYSTGFVRQSDWASHGTYGCEMIDPSTFTDRGVCRRDYGKMPSQMKLRFKYDTSKGYIFFGYGPRNEAGDYELGIFAMFGNANRRLYTGTFNTGGEIVLNAYSTMNAGMVNGNTYYLDVTLTDEGDGTTTLLCHVRDTSDVSQGSNTATLSNTNWSFDIFFGASAFTDIADYFVDQLEVWD